MTDLRESLEEGHAQQRFCKNVDFGGKIGKKKNPKNNNCIFAKRIILPQSRILGFCAQETVNPFFMQRIWKLWPVPDQEESRNIGTYLLQTLSGSSLRYRSGFPLHWWWYSQCPSSSSGPGRRDRGCASAPPEWSSACRTVEGKRSESPWGTRGRELRLGSEQRALRLLYGNSSQRFRTPEEQFAIMFSSQHAAELARTY